MTEVSNRDHLPLTVHSLKDGEVEAEPSSVNRSRIYPSHQSEVQATSLTYSEPQIEDVLWPEKEHSCYGVSRQ